MAEKYRLTIHPLANAQNVVASETYRFTVLTDRLIRMEYQSEGKFVDAPTQRVLCRDFAAVDFRVLDKGDSLEIITNELHLYYDKKPFTKEGLVVELKRSFHVYGSAWAYGDEIRDLKGTARTLDQADGAIELEAGLLSRGGFTVLDDSVSALLDDEQWPIAKDWESIDLYFFGYGHDYLGCLKDFYKLSGATPLLPRFALGNWWSRYYKYTEESYLKLMDRFRDEHIPFSTAVIDMDWHLTDIPEKYGSGWTGYTWNPKYFPDPKRFMDELHRRNMKITLNTHPADGVRGHEESYLPMAKGLGVDWQNEDKIPFDASNRDFLKAYFKYLHHPNEARGVDFWWLDWQQGSRGSAKGIDTLWLLNHLHFLDSGRDGKTPLTFSRYAGIGSHRYPVGFSGDTVTTWDSLAFQPYFTANASNAGYTWWSHDIGGHMNGYRDDELALRWVQLGVFSPILRLHSSANEFYGKEPWNFNIAVEKSMKDFLRLRHKLLPYLHTMNHLTHREGLPLVQPMYYHHDVQPAYQVPNQYYFGTEMIVCPITQPADKQTLLGAFDAWLPEGDFIDLFSGTHYKGGRKLTLHRAQDALPVLVRAGGIIPFALDFADSHLNNPKALEVQIFNGAPGSFDLYEDNGGEPIITRFTFTPGKTARIQAKISGHTRGVIPADRVCQLVLRGVHKPEEVLLNGEGASWSYDEDKKALTLCIACGAKSFAVEIAFPDDSIAAPDRTAALYSLLHRAQIEYNLKTAIYDAVCAEVSLPRLLAKLQELTLSEPLRSAVQELLLAEE